jgi:hypothetical protein
LWITVNQIIYPSNFLNKLMKKSTLATFCLANFKPPCDPCTPTLDGRGRGKPYHSSLIKYKLVSEPEHVSLLCTCNSDELTILTGPRNIQRIHPAGVTLKWGAAPTPYHEPSKADECRFWLADQLMAAGEAGLRPVEIVERGADQGFSRAMIYRARYELDASIANTHGHKHPENAWKWTSPAPSS